jgi:hypothetical protein
VPTQQPLASQPFAAQHGCPGMPHATTVPFEHTMPLAFEVLDARHEPPTQQPPPEQVVPPQQDWPARPHTSHFPPLQLPPVEQVAAGATHS